MTNSSSRRVATLILNGFFVYMFASWLVFFFLSHRAGQALLVSLLPFSLLLNRYVRDHYRWDFLVARLKRRFGQSTRQSQR